MSSVAIECIELSKIYGKRITALNNLILSIEEGASFGLLGENGAGKSTLVRLIMGFIFPTAGQVRVLGEERVAQLTLGLVTCMSDLFLRHASRDGLISPIWRNSLGFGDARVALVLRSYLNESI